MDNPSSNDCALLLHGLIGTLKVASSASLDPGVLSVAHRSNGSAARSRVELITVVAARVFTHVVRANPRTRVDIFVHSWNPEVAESMREQYGTALCGSLHERLEVEPKARSQALSIGRAALLMRAHEIARGAPYRLALVMRHDLIILAPVHLSSLSANGITFSHWCCKFPPKSRGRPEGCAADASRAADASHAAVLGACTLDLSSYNRRQRSNFVNAHYFQMDWWFATAPAVAASWINISAAWDDYASANAALGIGRVWSHFIWAQHVRDMLHARVQYSSAVCGELARYHFQVNVGKREKQGRSPCGEAELARNALGGQRQQCPAARRCSPVKLVYKDPRDGLYEGRLEHTFARPTYSLGNLSEAAPPGLAGAGHQNT